LFFCFFLVSSTYSALCSDLTTELTNYFKTNPSTEILNQNLKYELTTSNILIKQQKNTIEQLQKCIEREKLHKQLNPFSMSPNVPVEEKNIPYSESTPKQPNVVQTKSETNTKSTSSASPLSVHDLNEQIHQPNNDNTYKYKFTPIPIQNSSTQMYPTKSMYTPISIPSTVSYPHSSSFSERTTSRYVYTHENKPHLSSRSVTPISSSIHSQSQFRTKDRTSDRASASDRLRTSTNPIHNIHINSHMYK
jgi:hypothetical protein